MGFFDDVFAKPFREIGRFASNNYDMLLDEGVGTIKDLGLDVANGATGGEFEEVFDEGLDMFGDIYGIEGLQSLEEPTNVRQNPLASPIWSGDPPPPEPVKEDNDLLSQRNLLIVSIALTAYYLYSKR
jgi:hypothetical protein